MGYKAAISTASATTTGAGASEGVLMNRALNLLSKILPWAGEKGIGAEANDFLPVSEGAIAVILAGNISTMLSLVWNSNGDYIPGQSGSVYWYQVVQQGR